jgi:hypothetical protein
VGLRREPVVGSSRRPDLAPRHGRTIFTDALREGKIIDLLHVGALILDSGAAPLLPSLDKFPIQAMKRPGLGFPDPRELGQV